jgi:hypothetical protein
MKNIKQPAMGGFSEYNEQAVQHAEIEASSVDTTEERALIGHLMEKGFAWEEAAKLLNLRDHLYENSEMHQRLGDDQRMQFARWLYEQGQITEL